MNLDMLSLYIFILVLSFGIVKFYTLKKNNDKLQNSLTNMTNKLKTNSLKDKNDIWFRYRKYIKRVFTR
jgi:hypothetical protein